MVSVVFFPLCYFNISGMFMSIREMGIAYI